ncbi:hypothetical protein MAF45_08625 [Mesosutterella sp. OilRF-GAM-744-9]|uniref:Rhodanese domain-containing protein n=1 Tax=Mesosutterella porci TaxID=2915351 RepID=A0ABS9MT46_9BURK|nr:hypothetical protein [Mesosutterella sp. oilRF-744-WT-GAM-9]MCG5031504.1 hypothetical protein [Mesosutterella sp. oilRF-744-WT-GAM-9]
MPQQKNLGGLAPQAALEYMKKTPDLIIVNVAGRGFYDRNHFEGEVNIPTEDLGEKESKLRLLALPSGRPVMLHCRRGHMVVGWFEVLRQLRPDIPEVSYIAGVPPFDEYNDWKRGW